MKCFCIPHSYTALYGAQEANLSGTAAIGSMGQISYSRRRNHFEIFKICNHVQPLLLLFLAEDGGGVRLGGCYFESGNISVPT